MVWEPAISLLECTKPLFPLGFQNCKLLTKQLSEGKSPHKTNKNLKEMTLFVFSSKG
jgi:hypothetical protein